MGRVGGDNGGGELGRGGEEGWKVGALGSRDWWTTGEQVDAGEEGLLG